MASGLNLNLSQLGSTTAGLIKQGVKSVGNYLGNQAQNSLAGGAKTFTGQLQQANAGQPMTATGETSVKSTQPGWIKPAVPVTPPPPPVKSDPLVDTNAAHDALIKATQDKLKTAKDALANAQTQGAGANDQIDVQGNIITKVPEKAADTTAVTKPPVSDAFGTNVGQLTDYGTGKEAPEVTTARNELSDLQKRMADETANISGSPEGLDFQQGQQQVVQNRYANLLSAAQTKLQNALTSQGQQIGAAGTAGGLAQPVSQFGLLTNPITGNALNTTAINGALQQAYDMYKAGNTSWDDILKNTGMNAYGPIVTNQLIDMINNGGKLPGSTTSGVGNNNSTFSPTAQNAAIGQNIKQGTASQQQGNDLSIALQTLDTLKPVMTQFLTDVPELNQANNKYANQQIQVALTNLGQQGKMGQWNMMINELQTYSSSILNSSLGSSLTPSQNTAAVALQNPSTLTANELKANLYTLSDLGANKESVLQGNVTANLGTNSGAYAGKPAVPVTSTKPAPQASGSPVTGAAAKGAGLSVLSWGTQFVDQVASNLVSLFTTGKMLGL
jgi:hypothetical protein